ncbi:hypothetical protein BDZ94DRAFT_1258823 [Collybia nuda]|uniref:F-box domain-containing protein n=1 Tax=Collybia nuda TaxID=64659 RepID=A0A9P5Y4M0_9AGAR|nr:hypothetical protein BDZ94DRAFT_1258823 [Collybia nuda]
MDIDSEFLRETLDLQESNDPPNKSQIQVLETFRVHCSDRITSLDEEISELETKLANLTQIRNNWTSKVDICTKILSPIRHLPPEIIVEIFIHCLPGSRSRTLSRLKAPILLCQICSAWRGIALGISALWEELAVCINYETTDSGNTVIRHVMAAGEWFSRAGPDALLNYSCDIHLSEETCYEAPRILSEVLLPYTRRCRTLDMSTWNVADVQAFLNISSDEISHLKKATLRFDIGEAESTPTVFFSAPSLRQLSLMAFASISAFHLTIDYMAVFPWRQLTHIYIAAIPPLIWADVFRQCHALQEGTFVLQEIASDHTTTEVPFKLTPTSLSQLLNLTIVCRHPAEHNTVSGLYELPTWLFGGLDFPLLAKLNLSLEDGGKGFNAKPLPRLPSLRSLSITNQALSVDNILTLFRVSPGIIELELKNYDKERIFHALAYEHDSEILLPMLKKITIHVNTSTFLPYQPFMHMVKSRFSVQSHVRPSLSSLREVSLLVSKEWSSIFRFAKAELQEHEPGLVVNLVVMPDAHWEKKRMEEYLE